MKFYIYTLGCKVNAYESKVMNDLLLNNGYTLDKENPDICIINTCSVTNTADHKSLKTIRGAIKRHPESIIIVTGCLTQSDYKNASKIEGVDIILGNKNKTKLIDYINEYKEKNKKQIDIYDISNIPFETMKLNNFNKTRAFVKIQDGCNNFCSYCIIPYTRGGVRSKKKEDVIDEITNLVNNGHKEIVLTGIHTGNYGAEFDNYDFADLLSDIIKINGLERLRISSIEMNEINDRVISLMKNSNILVDHMHIPLQSGSNKILKLMNRKYNKEEFIKKIEDIRKVRPNISITTDVIVGFPNETEVEFNETIDTINKIKFTKLHVFPYSRRKGTVADTMDGQIDEKVKKERVKVLLELSKKLELDYMSKYINKEVVFIPEIEKDGYVIGHTGNYLEVKCIGKKEELGKDKIVTIKKIEYPYVIGK